MNHLQTLKLVLQQKRRLLAKVEQQRAKLIGKLEEQLALAEALVSGERYEPLGQVWATNSDGERIRIELPKRVRLCSWLNVAG